MYHVFTANKHPLTIVLRNSWCGYAPIPVELLKKLHGFGAANPSRMRNQLVRAGLLTQKRKPHAFSSTCSYFWVLFPFIDDDSGPIESMDAAIIDELSDDGVRERFGSYYANKIIAKVRIDQSESDNGAA